MGTGTRRASVDRALRLWRRDGWREGVNAVGHVEEEGVGVLEGVGECVELLLLALTPAWLLG